MQLSGGVCVGGGGGSGGRNCGIEVTVKRSCVSVCVCVCVCVCTTSVCSVFHHSCSQLVQCWQSVVETVMQVQYYGYSAHTHTSAHTMTVFEFPPRESWSSRVSLELR